MEKMGYVEGKGLGKNEDGITKHLVVKKKEESTGLGLEQSLKELDASTENWWHVCNSRYDIYTILFKLMQAIMLIFPHCRMHLRRLYSHFNRKGNPRKESTHKLTSRQGELIVM